MTDPRIAALPCWDGPIAVTRLSGGLSNEILKVTDAAGAHVVRLGTDYPFHHVDRAREAMTTRAAAEAGFAPAVEYTAPSVMVTAFITAQTLTGADLCADPGRVGALLRRFHTDMPARIAGAAFLFWPFHVIRDYLRQLGPDAPQGYGALNVALEATQPPLPLIFGHNDLLPANVLNDGERLWLIDYEYAGFGTCLFDLAGVSSNAGMDRPQALDLLTAYLGHTPDAAFLRAFDAMQVASLLRETLWAHVSAQHLRAPGVNYGVYASENADKFAECLDRYQTRHGKIST